MQGNADTIGCNRHDRGGHGFSRAEKIPCNSVIPSEGESFAWQMILRSRGTCFWSDSTEHSKPKSSLVPQICQITTGLSTPQIDSQASRFASLEMTIFISEIRHDRKSCPPIPNE